MPTPNADTSPSLTRSLALACLALAAALFPACATRARVESQVRNVVLEPDFRVSVYAAEDANTADIFLTDLSPDELSGAIPIDAASGALAHIRLFLNPRPGRTPIDPTAISATVRLIVLATGEVGVYGGGGFIRPRGRPGDYTIRIDLENASLALVRASDGFEDLLGASVMQAHFNARRDEPAAQRLADLRDRLLERAPLVEQLQP